MLRYGLKTKFSVNLLIILLVAMLMLAFVMMMISRQELVRTMSQKAGIVISAVQALVAASGSTLNDQVYTKIAPRLQDMMAAAGMTCGRLYDTHMRCYTTDDRCQSVVELSGFVRQAVNTDKMHSGFSGSTWGFFWKRPEYMVFAAPLVVSGRQVGAIGMVYDMGKIYAHLRKNQKILFYYILINALLLTFFGVYRLWQITGKPLQKLVRRADDYQPDGDLLFLSDDEESEFNKLSRSLNRMLENIAADKKKLKTTVLSLEAANAELKNTHKEMLRAEKMASVGRLSSGIAHEIGNPIGIVLGYLDLLRQGDLTKEERFDFIERAQDEIGRINNIIRELLDFSRPARDIKQNVSVHTIIEEVADMLQQQPLMKNIILHRMLGAVEHNILADPQRLRQVFLNLLLNASDAIHMEPVPGEGRILIESGNVYPDGKDRPHLQVVFADNGPGIPDDEVNTVFDPFFTTKDPGKGTGLGLSVCFMIMEETGGEIRVDTAVEKGSRFILTFPCVERNTSS